MSFRIHFISKYTSNKYWILRFLAGRDSTEDYVRTQINPPSV